MHISDRGLDLIKQFEGLELEAYQDIVGVWTIGYGHTSMAGPPDVVPGMEISEREATQILKRDLDQYESAVKKAVKVNITQNMFDALTSITYNIGVNGMKSSTFSKRLNNKDYIGAAEAMKWWNKAGGEVVTGLVRRRNAEAALFLEGYEEEVEGKTEEIARGSTVEENGPRRGNLATSRTMGGATAAGGAGAVAAGAAVMGDDDEEGDSAGGDDDGGGGSDEGTEGSGSVDFAGTVACVPQGEPDAAAGLELTDPDNAEPALPSSSPCPEGWTVIVIAKNDEVEILSDENDEVQTASLQLPEDNLFVTMFQDQEEVGEAVGVSAGVLAILSALYVAGARIDDWRNHKR
jgi:lysozyme